MLHTSYEEVARFGQTVSLLLVTNGAPQPTNYRISMNFPCVPTVGHGVFLFIELSVYVLSGSGFGSCVEHRDSGIRHQGNNGKKEKGNGKKKEGGKKCHLLVLFIASEEGEFEKLDAIPERDQATHRYMFRMASLHNPRLCATKTNCVRWSCESWAVDEPNIDDMPPLSNTTPHIGYTQQHTTPHNADAGDIVQASVPVIS